MGKKAGTYRLSLYRRGRTWWVAAWDPEFGRMRYMSLRETESGIARARRDDLQAQWNRGVDVFPPLPGAAAAPEAPVATAFEKAVERYLAWRQPQVAAQTLENDRSRLKRFREISGTRDVRQITARQVESYLLDVRRRQAVPTYNQHLMTLRRFLAWVQKRNLRQDNPAASWKVVRPEVRPAVHLTLEERGRVLAAVRGHPAEIQVLLCLGCGLRRAEAERMEWRCLELERRQLVVEKAKGRRARSVPIPREVAERLRQIRGGPGLVPSVARGMPTQKFWTWLRARARVPKANWLNFRHTFGSLLAQAGASLYKIGTWMGHRDPRTTADHYATLAPGYDADVELGP